MLRRLFGYILTKICSYGCALTAACYDGTEEIVKALLSKGADPNKQGGDYGNPLQAAAWFGDAEIVKVNILSTP